MGIDAEQHREKLKNDKNLNTARQVSAMCKAANILFNCAKEIISERELYYAIMDNNLEVKNKNDSKFIALLLGGILIVNDVTPLANKLISIRLDDLGE